MEAPIRMRIQAPIGTRGGAAARAGERERGSRGAGCAGTQQTIGGRGSVARRGGVCARSRAGRTVPQRGPPRQPADSLCAGSARAGGRGASRAARSAPRRAAGRGRTGGVGWGAGCGGGLRGDGAWSHWRVTRRRRRRKVCVGALGREGERRPGGAAPAPLFFRFRFVGASGRPACARLARTTGSAQRERAQRLA